MLYKNKYLTYPPCIPPLGSLAEIGSDYHARAAHPMYASWVSPLSRPGHDEIRGTRSAPHRVQRRRSAHSITVGASPYRSTNSGTVGLYRVRAALAPHDQPT